jgi:hypothetical protein
MKASTKIEKPTQDAVENQRSDQVEPMHRGAKAEADDFSDGRRQQDSERGASESDQQSPFSGGTTGEHSGQDATSAPPQK